MTRNCLDSPLCYQSPYWGCISMNSRFDTVIVKWVWPSVKNAMRLLPYLCLVVLYSYSKFEDITSKTGFLGLKPRL